METCEMPQLLKVERPLEHRLAASEELKIPPPTGKFDIALSPWFRRGCRCEVPELDVS